MSLDKEKLPAIKPNDILEPEVLPNEDVDDCTIKRTIECVYDEHGNILTEEVVTTISLKPCMDFIVQGSDKRYHVNIYDFYIDDFEDLSDAVIFRDRSLKKWKTWGEISGFIKGGL